MPVLMLREDDVRKVLTMEMAMEGVEIGLKKLGIEEAMNINRARVVTDHGCFIPWGHPQKLWAAWVLKFMRPLEKVTLSFSSPCLMAKPEICLA